MGKFTEFKLPLKALPAGVHTFTYAVGKQFFADMDNADVRDAALTVSLTVTSVSADSFELHFNVHGELTVLCDRCLDEMQWPVEASYDVTVRLGDEYRDDSDEVLEIPANPGTLNVAYMIHDTAALALPLKHTHPMGQCNRAMSAMLRRHRALDADDAAAAAEDELLAAGGDAPAPEAPSDPRWDALKDLQ